MQKTVVFIDVPPDCVQHKLLIYFFRRTIVEPAEVFVLLDISKVAFSLNGSDLSVQDSFFTLDIPIGFFLQFFPPFIDLHHFLSVWFFFFISIQAF